jgi:hypothetical protein
MRQAMVPATIRNAANQMKRGAVMPKTTHGVFRRATVKGEDNRDFLSGKGLLDEYVHMFCVNKL